MSIKHLIKLAVLFLGALLLSSVQADEQSIRETLQKVMPNVKPDSITPSPVGGVYEVMIGTQIFYMSGDGKYIIQGSIYDINERKDISEEKIAKARVKAISEISPDQMIVFAPEESKHTITVFTDIDCGYCRKLHSEMDQYHKNGITINYMFYPRAGKGSESYKKAVSVWCSEDRNKSLTQAKKNEPIDEKTCDNPVDEHYELGQKLGASGTPMLVTEKGTVLPGYIPADRLAKALTDEKSGKKIQ